MKQVERYGVAVWEDEEMDALRKKACLCLNCHKLGNCQIGAEGYDLCKRHNIAFMVTRCPSWTAPEPKP